MLESLALWNTLKKSTSLRYLELKILTQGLSAWVVRSQAAFASITFIEIFKFYKS